MPKGNIIEATGVVTEALPNLMFRVKLEDREILATLSGKMRLYRIRVMPGDHVKVELTPYYLTRGRLVFRNK